MIKIAGHRGFPQRYPENSLSGFAAAIDQGAQGLECDVQFNRWGQAFILHDETLARTAGLDQSIADLSADQAHAISVHEAPRFGEQHQPTPLPLLSEFAALIRNTPNVLAFVEIKEESFAWILRDDALRIVSEILTGLESQVILISFDLAFIEAAKNNNQFRVGWVFEEYNKDTQNKADTLKPDFLACDYHILEDKDLWPGTWSWFVYDVIDPALAQALEARGIDWLETWNLPAVIQTNQTP